MVTSQLAFKERLHRLGPKVAYSIPVLSHFPSFSPPDVLCDPTVFIWRQGTLFEAMTGAAVFIDGLFAEDFN